MLDPVARLLRAGRSLAVRFFRASVPVQRPRSRSPVFAHRIEAPVFMQAVCFAPPHESAHVHHGLPSEPCGA